MRAWDQDPETQRFFDYPPLPPPNTASEAVARRAGFAETDRSPERVRTVLQTAFDER